MIAEAIFGSVDTADPNWPIRVRGLRKSFDNHEVLRGVDLDVESAKINFVIGRSGEGKSVLLKHLIGLFKPDAGHIWVDGEDITELPESELARERRKFGMLFQHAALFDSMTVAENVAFPLVDRHAMSREEVTDRVRDLLRRLDVADTEALFPSQLSGGQRKRVALARALIDRPQIMLYDEPTSGLDPIAVENVDNLIRFTAKEFGVTSVVVSHDMVSVFRIGDRIAMLHEGRIVAAGTRDEIARSSHPELRRFLETAASLPSSRLSAPASRR